jgi:cell division protein FtsI (penicillin-binding protein 3)
MQARLATASPEENSWLYPIFGKSGTAEIPLGKAPPGKRAPRGASGYFDNQYNSSFIAGGPTHDPRLVVICIIDDPGPAKVRSRTHYGAAVAGPVVRRVMDQVLVYMGVPVPDPSKDRIAQADSKPAPARD